MATQGIIYKWDTLPSSEMFVKTATYTETLQVLTLKNYTAQMLLFYDPPKTKTAVSAYIKNDKLSTKMGSNG